MGRIKLVLLLSGGIDSPIAGHLMGRQGAEIAALYGHVTEGDREADIGKMVALAGRIADSIGDKVRLHVYDQCIALARFRDNARPGLTCVLCKRAMLRMAERLCERIGGSAVITGDSLGQVASQTLQNISVIENAVSVPVLRPLIGLDKVDIVHLAERIGTYGISTASGAQPCEFVPRRPITRAKIDEVLEEEKRIGIEAILDEMAGTLSEVRNDRQDK